MKISQVLFLLVSIIYAECLFAQNCKQQGPLIWIKEHQLVQRAVYSTASNIEALFYNPSQTDSLVLDLKIGAEELSLQLPLEEFTDLPKPLVSVDFGKKYSKLVLVPTPYPKADQSYQQLAQMISKNNSKELTIIYRGAETPISGCITLDLRKGLGQYDLSTELAKLEAFNTEKKALQKSMLELEKQEAEKLRLYEMEEERRAQSNQQREQLRVQHQNLSTEEQSILGELIDLSNQVGVALNQALLTNDKAMAREVADFTGNYQKRMNEVQKMPIYNQIKTSFDNYYRQSIIYFTHDRNMAQLDLQLQAIRAAISEKKEALEKLEAKIQAYLNSDK